MSHILCTVGTSIAAGCPAIQAFHREPHPWDEAAPHLRAEILARLKDERFNPTTSAGRIAASAELNSLERLKCGAGNTVVLLATDTADGRACAEALKSVIESVFGVKSCQIRRIHGLQVRDGEKLRKEGIPNLCRVLLHYLRDPNLKYQGGVIVNPTGGFKGIVPFLVILAALYGAKAVYIFENSDTLIQLPPLPISLDRGLFEQAHDALSWAKREGAFRPEAFYHRVPNFDYSVEDRLNGFLEFDGEGMATLSTLAEVLLEAEEQSSGTVRLAPEMMEKLSRYPSDVRQHVGSLLRRAGSAAWRFTNGHSFTDTDLQVFGNGQFKLRLAGFVEQSTLYVCRFYFSEHDSYELELAKVRRRDFDADQFEELPPDPATPDESAFETPGKLRSLIAETERQLRDERAAHRKTLDSLGRLRALAESMGWDSGKAEFPVISQEFVETRNGLPISADPYDTS